MKRPLTKSTSFHDKSPGEIRDTRDILKTHSKPITNKKLNGEKLKAIPLQSGIRQDCPSICTQYST